MRPGKTGIPEDRDKENEWLQKVMEKAEKCKIDDGDLVSWAANHAGSTSSGKLRTQVALMPMFRDPSHSFAMIPHCLMTNKLATEFLNPGQIPVKTMDQPFY